MQMINPAELLNRLRLTEINLEYSLVCTKNHQHTTIRLITEREREREREKRKEWERERV